MEMSSVPTPLGQPPQPSTNTNSSSADYNLSSPNSDSKMQAYHADQAAAEATASKITNLKFLNGTSYVLTSLLVIGTVLGRVREEGTFADDYLWMKYQTLLTPATAINYIWIPIFIFQGLFIYASILHPTLQSSPLVGYNAAINIDGTPSQSIAVHYPAICATTLMMVYSYDCGFVLCALVSSVLCGAVLVNVLKIQMGVLIEMEEGGGQEEMDVKSRSLQYASLRLPFEFYGGYVVALIALFFNMYLHMFDVLPMMAYLVVANVSVVALLGTGFWMLWKVPERKFYGAGVALVWYLLGVAAELIEPTQPIYNEFPDGAILTTQIVAGVATTALMVMLGVRITKTMIKHNIFNCGSKCNGGDNSFATDEEKISTGYVQA